MCDVITYTIPNFDCWRSGLYKQSHATFFIVCVIMYPQWFAKAASTRQEIIDVATICHCFLPSLATVSIAIWFPVWKQNAQQIYCVHANFQNDKAKLQTCTSQLDENGIAMKTFQKYSRLSRRLWVKIIYCLGTVTMLTFRKVMCINISIICNLLRHHEKFLKGACRKSCKPCRSGHLHDTFSNDAPTFR